MPAPNLKYRSGNFLNPVAVGALRNESPLLPELNSILIFHQDFMQDGDHFIASPYNTQNPQTGGGINTSFLINESPREDVGGGIVKWTRSWARIPISYSKSGGVYQFQYPAIQQVGGQNRDEIIIPVQLRIQRDFFLCGTSGVFFGGFDQWENIPIIKKFLPYNTDSGPSSYTTILDDSTTPSATAYLASIAAAEEIVIEDSRITPWAGNIYVRDTFYAKAQ